MRMMRSILLVCCALWLMMSCGEGKGDRLKQLEMLEEMNRADSVMNNDSLAEDLVDYFDKHGSPNEQMRARYILGRTYFDLGELPRALETYLKATDCADTTASDCDYKTLSRVYANMAKKRRVKCLSNDNRELNVVKYSSHVNELTIYSAASITESSSFESNIVA